MSGPRSSETSSFGTDPFSASANPPSPAEAGRVPTLWPFSRDSIWNLPIGAGAVYVPANITKARAWGMTVDQDVLILTPDAPVTPVYYNDDAWDGGDRCSAEGGVLFEAPIPSDFVVPGARSGYTPNFATAILQQDNRTLVQGQPMARCTEGGTTTIWWSQTREDLYGPGFSGGHGGSMLSSMGGTIRFGELVPGGAIRHSLKVNLDGADNLWYDPATRGYRWPATTADSCASACYGGSNPTLRMGSLLALPSGVDIEAMGLETEAALILARAFQDYGGYVVDNTGWSVYALSTEYSPQNGWLEDEFLAAWGYEIDPKSRDVPWARDMDRIFGALHVVENWNEALWLVVSPSNGSLGAGDGLPRVPWAPDFAEAPDPDQVPPVTTSSLSGTAGSSDWYRSPVTVSLTATDAGSGVASIHVRVDGGAWIRYGSPVTVSGQGVHTVSYYATDTAGNVGAVQSLTLRIDSMAPTTAAALSGILGSDGLYRSPVTVTLTATDSGSGVAGIRARTAGGTWFPYGSPWTISGDGSHTVEYVATDLAGNPGALRTVTFTIDSHAPITTYALSGTLGASGWYVSTVRVMLGATGVDGRTASVSYRLDGSRWVAYSGPFVVGGGRHTLDYRATDSRGNVGPVRSFAIPIDYTPPTITRADGSGAIRPGASLSWTGSDDVSGIVGYDVSLDGGPFRSVATQTSVTGPPTEGRHLAIVRAFDAAGNEGTATIVFTVDRNAPHLLGPEPISLAAQAGTLIRLLLGVWVLGLVIWYIPCGEELWAPRSRTGRKEVASGGSNAERSDLPADASGDLPDGESRRSVMDQEGDDRLPPVQP